MKKIRLFRVALAFAALSLLMGGCGGGKEERHVVIYTPLEDFRSEPLEKRLREELPTIDISLQYLSTGNLAARLQAEGTGTECDIVVALESSYLDRLRDLLEPLEGYDFDRYLENLRDPEKKYAVWSRYSGAVVVNTDVLEKRGLTAPQSYDDLLRPEYKGLVSMPNPKASGTGAMFLQSLAVSRGEEEALRYFERLADNVLSFTSSGTGPVNALVQGEVAVALGMTFQAVREKEDGAPLDIRFFEEGAPYNTDGFAIIAGHGERQEVQQVFRFLYDTFIFEDKENFLPEPVFRDQGRGKVKGYPQDIPYADMGELDERERLLDRWDLS